MSSFQPEIDLGEVRERVKNELSSTAFWRRTKAAQYAQDTRNRAAAERLERLTSTVDAVPDELIRLFALHWGDGEDPSFNLERWHEELRSIGFTSHPETAAEFLKCFGDAD
jgi:hypothetical protein